MFDIFLYYDLHENFFSFTLFLFITISCRASFIYTKELVVFNFLGADFLVPKSRSPLWKWLCSRAVSSLACAFTRFIAIVGINLEKVIINFLYRPRHLLYEMEIVQSKKFFLLIVVTWTVANNFFFMNFTGIWVLRHYFLLT